MEDIERELFEAWMREACPGVDLQRRVDGEYWSNTPDNFWEGWKARSTINVAASVPLLARIAELEYEAELRRELHKTANEMIGERDSRIAALTAKVEQAARPVDIVCSVKEK